MAVFTLFSYSKHYSYKVWFISAGCSEEWQQWQKWDLNEATALFIFNVKIQVILCVFSNGDKKTVVYPTSTGYHTHKK